MVTKVEPKKLFFAFVVLCFQRLTWWDYEIWV